MTGYYDIQMYHIKTRNSSDLCARSREGVLFKAGCIWGHNTCYIALFGGPKHTES